MATAHDFLVDDDLSHADESIEPWPGSMTTPKCRGATENTTAMILAACTKSFSLLQEPSLIPSTEILAADKTFIEIYFRRHPSDLVMSSEFIHEMNSFIIYLLQQSPAAVSEALSAIGENYMSEMSSETSMRVSNRKTRLMKRLILVNEDGSSVELIAATLLGLCGVEVRSEPLSSSAQAVGNTGSSL